MQNITPFNFKRTKGIVWVCDLVNSSAFLNDNKFVDDLEAFIPRLYYLSKQLVESYGGVFLKWTGDGFLAFFEVELDREKVTIAEHVYNAAWHLSFMCNVTKLGLETKANFRVRHGIAYEKDALVMIMDINENKMTDIIGRSVVLAFRLSGVDADFPCVVTTREIVASSNKSFVAWKPDSQERLKYFKGESYGLRSIVRSKQMKQQKPVTIETTVVRGRKAISKANQVNMPLSNSAIAIFVERINTGPDWCKDIIAMEVDFIKDNLIGSIEKFIDVYRKSV